MWWSKYDLIYGGHSSHFISEATSAELQEAVVGLKNLKNLVVF